MIGKIIAQLIQWIMQGLCGLIDILSHPLTAVFGDRVQTGVAKNKKSLIVVICLLIVVGSLTSIYLTYRTPTPKLNPKPFAGLGEVVAEETAKLLKDQGDIVLVIFKPGKGPLTDALTIPADTFRSALKSHPNLRIVATETVVVDTTPLGLRVGMSAERFTELIKQYRHVAGIVSFVGLSAKPGTTWPASSERLPKIVLAGGYSPLVGELLRNNAAQVAIIPRFRPPALDKKPVTPHDWFESYYSIVTAANLSDLPTYQAPAPTN
ncbi:MAG: hypothetical protein WCS70_05430 [Verrucomicrobiota bacterium]